MKRTLIIWACTIACALSLHAQDTAGYKVNGTTITATKSTRTSSSAPKVSTGMTYEDTSGNKYPVYESKNGKFYVVKKSAKTGKEYNYYLPAKFQSAFGEMKKNLKK